MLDKETVLILGAGASQPYKFPTGRGLLDELRRCTVDQIAEFIKPRPRFEAPPLFTAMRDTGETSIDAVLEGQSDIREAGKTLIARCLLQCERNSRNQHTRTDLQGAWYTTLFEAMIDKPLEVFRRNPLAIFTYNYDRSLDNFLVTALSAKFRDKTREQCAEVLDCIGPFHLHGQLGALPDFPASALRHVPYGGDTDALTDSNVAEAASGIVIIDEPGPHSENFIRLRDALSKAERVVFLGFGFGATNVGRLRFQDCLDAPELFATAMGPPRQKRAVSDALGTRSVVIGESN
jgi:hypothetical protein